MSWRRRALPAFGLASLLAVLVVLAQPSPPPARANIACEAASAPAHALTGGIGAITGGAIGGGNPVGEACNSLTDGVVGAVTAPITSALKGIGSGIFNQITGWVTEGATWLIGQVISAIDQTTTPQLTTKGFLSEYGRMAEIAVFLAAAMLLAAVLEGLAQGSSALLVRVVLVNLPLAFLATSVAYAVVQLLLVATDGLCHAIAVATAHNSQRFFTAAIGDLGKAGGTAGKAGRRSRRCRPRDRRGRSGGGRDRGAPLRHLPGGDHRRLRRLLRLDRAADARRGGLRRRPLHAAGAGGLDLAALVGHAAPQRRAARRRDRLEVRDRLDHQPRRRADRRKRRPDRAHPRRLGADAARLLLSLRPLQTRPLRRGRDGRRLRASLSGGRCQRRRRHSCSATPRW